MLRTFLPVLTYPCPSPTPGLQRVLDLAAMIESDVLAKIVEIDIPPISRPSIPLGIDVVGMAAQAEALSQSRADDVVDHLRAAAKRMKLQLTIERTRSRPEWVGATLSLGARVHDFSMMSLGDSDEERGVAEALIFGSGGPVVLAPGSGEVPTHLSTIAIAWDGSAASARALRDALPLLTRAERVIIFTAQTDKQIDPQSVEGAQAMLDSRGINNSHFDVLVTGHKPIGEALQEAALRKDAGLLVMGGYGHSRVREFILGGATRSVLASLRIAVLMSH